MYVKWPVTLQTTWIAPKIHKPIAPWDTFVSATYKLNCIVSKRIIILIYTINTNKKLKKLTCLYPYTNQIRVCVSFILLKYIYNTYALK